MFHTLLVAIDGGPQTRRIAELARQAAAPGARVHLLCAVDAGYALPGRPTLLDYPPAAHECEEARQVLDEASCAASRVRAGGTGRACVPATRCR